MRLTLLSSILAASYATFASAQNLASVLSLLPAAFAGVEELVSLLPVQCAANGTHFASLETGYAMATAQQTWTLISQFGNYTWAGLNVTQMTPPLLNATGTGATRSYLLAGKNVTDTLLFEGGLDGKAYAAVFETSGMAMMNSSSMNSFMLNGTSFDRVVSALVVLNNSLSVGSHIVWVGVGCTSGNASAAQSTYSGLSLAALRDIVRNFAT